MNRNEFEREMARLVNTFGKTHYNIERTTLIWEAVRPYSVAWWARAVDEFIGSFRSPPLLPEIRDAVARERERQWGEQKKENAANAKEFMNYLGSEEISEICRGIRQRITGQMSDENFTGFVKVLDGLKHR